MQKVFRSPGTNHVLIPPRMGQGNNSRKSLDQYQKSLSLPVGYEEKASGLPTKNFDAEHSNLESNLAGDNHSGSHNPVL